MSLSYYQRHKEELKAKEKARREANPELYKQRGLQYREKNRQQINTRQNQKRKQHGDEIRAKEKQWRDNNKQKKAEIDRKWRQKNKQWRKQYDTKYYIENKQRLTEANKEKYWQNRNKEIEKCKITFENLAKYVPHKPIPNYKEQYQAFENGQIWSWIKFKFLKQRLNNSGHLEVMLVDDRKYTEAVHRLIALTFDDRTVEQLVDYDCHHCDISASNNQISNLVFLPKNIHIKMHKNLDQQTIKAIGVAVQDLRGSAKTNRFVELVEELFYKQT